MRSEFLDCSYGYRPGRSAKDAVRDLSLQLTIGKFGYLVEADIRGFFEHMDHDWLLRMLSLRIDDRAFLDLIRKWLKAGILDTDGTVLHPEKGDSPGRNRVTRAREPLSALCARSLGRAGGEAPVSG